MPFLEAITLVLIGLAGTFAYAASLKLFVPCPRCGQPARWAADNPARPFCSERCKLIDLGAWATESHRIPGDPVPPQDDE